MTPGIEHFVHHVPGVQLAGKVPSYLADVVSHDRLSTGGCELRSHPRRQSIVPDQRVPAYLDVVGATEGDKIISVLEVVHTGLAAQRIPLHVQFRSGDVALR